MSKYVVDNPKGTDYIIVKWRENREDEWEVLGIYQQYAEAFEAVERHSQGTRDNECTEDFCPIGK